MAGLLLIGLVADDDGLFAWAGRLLGRAARDGTVLFAGARPSITRAARIGLVAVPLSMAVALGALALTRSA